MTIKVGNMRIQKETKWLCENAKGLEEYSGQWVVFSANEGLVCKGACLERIMKESKKRKLSLKPFVFHVPPKEIAEDPLPAIKRF